jgi:stage II sporulation protein M
MLGKGKYEGFFSGLYKRNEKFLILSAAIFLSSLFIGYFLSGAIDQLMGPILKELKRGVASGQIKITTLSIFANNFKIAFSIYIGGLLFGAYTAFSLFINGTFIGYAASKLSLGTFVLYSLPHGIFEIIGIIIAGAAGFRLASFIINFLRGVTRIRTDISVMEQIIYHLDLNLDEFKESVGLFVIAAILILIAAFIEANFSIAWAHYIQGAI